MTTENKQSKDQEPSSEAENKDRPIIKRLTEEEQKALRQRMKESLREMRKILKR